MEEDKRKKIIKIVLWCLLGLVLAFIIGSSIASAVFKDKKENLDKNNQQIEDILSED